MSSAAEIATSSSAYDGQPVHELARRLNVPRVVAFEEVTSTLDVAHSLAAQGAPAGTLIVADAQTAGRGRQGRVWRSDAGAGIWLTLIERPRDAAAIDVLSLRIGLALAPALEVFAADRVRLKWPNDVYVGVGKLAGVLAEARWRDGAPEWVAIGVGVNVRAPRGEQRAAGLHDRVSRLQVLEAVVPAIRAAAAKTGPLGGDELAAFADRDFAAGRFCVEPVVGRVEGIDPSGALLVDVGSGVTPIRAGSLVLREEQ